MARKKTDALSGSRILVVEDDYLIAQDVCDYLRNCGAEIVGPVGRLDQGVDLARDTQDLHCAILDLNLNGESAAEIARVLRSRGIGFVLVTGYDTGGISAEFSAAPRLVKPFDSGRLCSVVEQEIGASH